MLARAFGSLQRAWEAGETRLREAGLDGETSASLLRTRDHVNLDREMAKIEQAGAHLLTPEDADYPSLLKNVADPPLALYVRGTITGQDSLALSIVGTRKATTYGRDASAYFARVCARRPGANP